MLQADVEEQRPLSASVWALSPPCSLVFEMVRPLRNNSPYYTKPHWINVHTVEGDQRGTIVKCPENIAEKKALQGKTKILEHDQHIIEQVGRNFAKPLYLLQSSYFILWCQICAIFAGEPLQNCTLSAITFSNQRC